MSCAGVIAAGASGSLSVPPPVTSGLRARYSADYEKTFYADGAIISTLHDMSGLGNHATGNGDPLMRYTGGPAGGPVLDGVSTGRRWILADGIFTGASAIEMFATIKSLGNNRGPVGAFASDQYFPFSDGNVYSDAFANSRPGFSVAAKPIVNTWRRLNIWSAANDWSFSLDETVVSSRASNVVTLGSAGGRWLGTSTNVGNPNGVQFGAVLFYDRKLTSGERSAVVTWLQTYPSGGL